MLEIFCDGACSGNPGKGGWAFVVFEDDIEIFSNSGYCENTTNNRMELTAAINAIDQFDNCNIILDSKYVKDGITKWINNWIKNNWKTANKKDVKNSDLWKILYKTIQGKNINFRWQKGHNHSRHDIADKYAVAAIKK